ncbi:MAG: methylated-DNA--[protein]-cysteine S-methyltransferase [Myxococcota bacterium]
METQRITEVEPNHLAVRGWGTLTLQIVGRLWVTWTARGLLSVGFDDEPSELSTLPQRNVPLMFAGPFRRYAEGAVDAFKELPLDMQGTEFQNRVWRALRDIPFGKVQSYASIASAIGAPRAARAVGMANANNPIPIVVPCHRVVESSLKLGGYAGGVERKRALLEHEGVSICGNRIQMSAS